MDETLRIPVPIYVIAVVFFCTPALVMLFLEGHWGAAVMTMFGLLYAVGLGRAQIWRRAQAELEESRAARTR